MSKDSNAEDSGEKSKSCAVDEVELKTIELRLNAIKDATHRSRFVFLVMTIMTATILISLWNAMLSWDRGMAFGPRPDASSINPNTKNLALDLVTRIKKP